jgi:hypothetical protein
MIRWTDQEWRHFFDLNAYCRVMREQAPPGWETTPDLTYAGSSVVERRSDKAERVGSTPTRRTKVTAGSLPTADGFWKDRGVEYDAAMGEWVEPGHSAHRKRSVNWLMHPSHCPPCGERKVRWMAAQDEATHVGRNGRRLAEIHGVAV